nr:MAG TPA: hypothetical protein [Caudoviricetes sp.]
MKALKVFSIAEVSFNFNDKASEDKADDKEDKKVDESLKGLFNRGSFF